MKNLSHLPEKFCFKLDELGKRWIRETFGSKIYDHQYEFFHYPNYTNFNGFFERHHQDSKLKDGYTLISTDQLFPQPQIPIIEKGVMMLVWDDDEKSAQEKEVVFFDGKYFVCVNKFGFYFRVKNAKPIPEYTIEEAEKQFNIKIKCTSTE